MRAQHIDDEKIFKSVFEKGNTVTIFQFNGAGMQKALKEVKASSMDDLIAVVALYRPGPMEYIPEYVKGKFNPGLVKYSHPLIEKYLKPTYGIMIYQEQAMFLDTPVTQLNLLNSTWQALNNQTNFGNLINLQSLGLYTRSNLNGGNISLSLINLTIDPSSNISSTGLGYLYNSGRFVGRGDRCSTRYL
jgi:hypothetical protein